MLDPKIVERLRDRYSDLHPLLFYRSVERAKSNGDLFDILDTLPQKYPLIWCEKTRRWITTNESTLFDEFFKEIK